MKDKFLITLSFVNKNDETESYDDEREEWSMEIAIGRMLREARATILKGRRDAKELTIVASRIIERKSKSDIEDSEPTMPEESFIEEGNHKCGSCGKALETNDALCDECYEKASIK